MCEQPVPSSLCRIDTQTKRMEEAKEELICPVCIEFYRRPRSLICLHSFCEECLLRLSMLQTVSNGAAIRCPECRAQNAIPDEGIEGFPLNFKLARLVEILSPAERDKIKRNRSETRPEQELGTCKLHDTKPLEYYCENCKILICGQCMITTHRKHEEVSYAKDVLPQHYQVLASLVPVANAAASTASATSEQLKEDIKEMKKQGSEKVRAIQGYFSRLRQALSDREDKLVEAIRQEMQEKEDTLLKKQHVIQMSLEDIRRDVQTINSIQEDDIRILGEETGIKSRLTTHIETIDNQKREYEKPVISPFVEDSRFEDRCRGLGGRSVFRAADLDSPYSPFSRRLQTRTRHSGSPHLPASRGSSFQSDIDPSDDDLYSHISEHLLVGSLPSTPRMRREYTIEILEPVVEIGPRSIGGAFFRTVTKEVLPCGVCSGKNNTIIVADIRSSSITILTNTGKCLEVIGTEGKGDGQFIEPTSVTTDSDGCILVADKGQMRVQKFAASGKFLSKFSTRSLRGQYLGEPWGITTSFDNMVLVTDREKSCIHMFDESGKYQRNFSPKDDTSFKSPTGIAVDKRGRIVVTDRESHSIWIFTPEGEVLNQFGKRGDEPGELYYPFGVAVDKDGFIYVAESGNHRVSVFDPQGLLVRCFGRKGSEPGYFMHPRHLCFDSLDRLVVADEHNHRLQIFSV